MPGFITLPVIDLLFDKPKFALTLTKQICPNGNHCAAKKPIEDATLYHIATQSFLADGGDGFTTFTEGKERNTAGGYYVSNAVIDYFKAGNTITDEQLHGMRVVDVKK